MHHPKSVGLWRSKDDIRVGNRPLEKGVTVAEGKGRMKRIRTDRGSATVEAALLVPVFLFVLLFFYHLLHVQTVRQVVYEAGIETAEYVAEYYYLQDSIHTVWEGYSNRKKGTDEAVSGETHSTGVQTGLLDRAAFLAVAGAKMQEYLDEPELIERYVSGGCSGISLITSELPDSDGELVFHIRYTICINTPLLPTVKKEVEETIRQKPYNGHQKKEDGDDTESDPYVYITDNREVYHLSRGCSHLILGITPMALKSAKEAGYRPCAFCGKEAGVLVLVGPEGDCYHAGADCSGLKRTVHRVRRSEVSGIPPCSRCGK